MSVCVTQNIFPQQGLGENVASNLSATWRFELEQRQGTPELYDLLGLDASQINQGCLQRKTVYHFQRFLVFHNLANNDSTESSHTLQTFCGKGVSESLQTLGITFKNPRDYL